MKKIMGTTKTLLQLIIKLEKMYKLRENYPFSKKRLLQPESIDNSRKIEAYSTNYATHYDTRESPYTQTHQKQSQQQVDSSRIADEGAALTNNYQSFQASILQKVESIESQSNKLLQKKQRQLFFLKTQLQNCQIRLEQAWVEIKNKDEQILRLSDELNRLSDNKTYKYSSVPPSKDAQQQLQQENEKLKESLRILIEQKNQNWKFINKQDKQYGFSYGRLNVHALKKQVQQLRAMVSQMQETVNNCPGCYSLRRQNKQLIVAYDCLIKQHSELTKAKSSHQKELLHNITTKIQQNQNILRQNIHLKQEKQERPYIRRKGERMKESIAKRCRTLTDQF